MGMGDPGRPKKRNVKLTCYLPPETKRAIQHEAIDRGMTIGEVIDEAMKRRTTVVNERNANNKTY